MVRAGPKDGGRSTHCGAGYSWLVPGRTCNFRDSRAKEAPRPHRWRSGAPESSSALFRWLRLPQQNELAQKLFGKDIDDASIHLVYSVPIQPDAVQSASRKERIDLVESAKIGLDLARRRDSRMELRQTNFISELALQTMWGTGKVGAVYPIFADEIAPSQEIKFDNNLAPRREELLKVVAAGCRSTLETLHRNTLTAWGAPPVACDKLLHRSPPGAPTLCSPKRPVSAKSPALYPRTTGCTRPGRRIEQAPGALVWAPRCKRV